VLFTFNSRVDPAVRRRAELLGYLSLFADCSKRELRRLADAAEVLRVGIDDPVVQEDAQADAFWVLAEGLAHVTMGERKIASIKPGNGFGELALLDGGRRTASVTAVLPGRVVRFGPDAFADRVLGTPAAADRLLLEAERRRVELLVRQ
jgi:CRP/FNR family cyclic AMP-dependent transcriptional regulator